MLNRILCFLYSFCLDAKRTNPDSYRDKTIC